MSTFPAAIRDTPAPLRYDPRFMPLAGARHEGTPFPLAKRFYHIAFELGVPPRTFIRELAGAGLSVGNQMIVIPEDLESRIREVWAQVNAPPAPEAPAQVAAVPGTDGQTEPSVGAEGVGEPMDVEEAEPASEPATPVESEPQEEPELEPVTAEAPASEEAVEPSAEVEAEDAAEPTPAPRKRRARTVDKAGEAPPSVDLVPTIDPRAGRLVKEAPRAGVPGVTVPTRGRPGDVPVQDLNPTIPQSERAPGQRRDSHRRSTVPDRYRGKRGTETFHMRRRSPTKRIEPARPRPTELEVEPPISVKRLSELSGLKAADIVKVLFTKHKMVVNVNSNLDKDQLELMGLEFDIDIKFVKRETAEDSLLAKAMVADSAEDLAPRPPVVTILGHVDHGKTTLLDCIRRTDVAAHEAGGITQHIGASQVTLPDGRKVTFIDTPGHEAFTEMRARGAQVTDVVVLIVAADDGVMPQTIEAISHAKAAGVPIIVAITKVDKANAQPQRVRQQLAEHDVYVEGYGGDVSVFEVSGITGDGVPQLLEHLALFAEVEAERFRANPTRPALGTVIEAQNSPRRGVVATVLVQNGTLHRGDAVLAGESWGTVRAMFNYLAQQVDEARPGDPAEIIGLDDPPEAGSKFYVLTDTNLARQISEKRRQEKRERELASQSKPTTLESLFGKIEEGKIQELNVVLKVDVRGSLEPVRALVDRLGTEEVRVKVIHSGVGAVNDSDVILASASTAWIIGFNVNVDERARDRAKMTGVDIRTYRVIYDIEQDVKAALEGKLAPEQREVVLGHAEVLAIFASSRLGKIAGCRVRDGVIRRDGTIRVVRGGQVVQTARMAGLRREKDEAREVKEGFECGMRLEGWDAFEEGDILECFTVEEVARTLGA